MGKWSSFCAPSHKGTKTRSPTLQRKIGLTRIACMIVGIPGFEPGTPCSQSRCANRTALHPELGFSEEKLCSLLLVEKGTQLLLAVWTGLEPATPCVTGRYSNQLNYHTSCVRCLLTAAKIALIFFFAKLLPLPHPSSPYLPRPLRPKHRAALLPALRTFSIASPADSLPRSAS